jgi:RNA recognition motif-containing protein
MYTICINNISADTSQFNLEAAFQPYGHILKVHVVKNHKTKASRGFAFVSFARQEDATAAIQSLQGYRFDYMIWNLEWARPRQNNNKARPKNDKCQQPRRNSFSTVSTMTTTTVSSVLSFNNSKVAMS